MNQPTAKHQQEARELLPCPFCGGVAILGMFNVWCSKCRAATDKDMDASADGIIRRWNKRFLSSRDQEIREVLEGLWNGSACWCQPMASSDKHEDACLAARGLWNRVNLTESAK